MAQNRQSGAAANKYGHDMAAKVARFLGADLISKISNEAILDGQRIVIKSARWKTPEIGLSLAMLERITGIIAALEEEDGGYPLYRLGRKWYRARMVHSRRSHPSHQNLWMLSCKVIRLQCTAFTRMN